MSKAIKKNWRPRLTVIDDPIADDYWAYRTEDGAKRTSRVTIGRPVALPDGKDWYCPMYFEHVTQGIDCVFGAGPVDALMNAMYYVRRRFYEFDDVTPRSKPSAGVKRSSTQRSSASKKASKRIGVMSTKPKRKTVAPRRSRASP
jgi:hypothetical protein